jgi:hypothetical protein
VYACINGGFFGGNQSYSLVRVNNTTQVANIRAVNRTFNGTSTPYYPTRAAFGVNAAGVHSVAWVYSIGTNLDSLIAYPNPSPNTTAATPQPQPTSSFPAGGSLWNVSSAIGGSPMLLYNNQIRITDTEELIDFIDLITSLKQEGELLREGRRSLVDMKPLSSSAFFHRRAGGSNSIKKVLPAMLEASDWLRETYSQPIYGGGRPNSRNFTEPMIWCQADENGRPLDPYRLLPPVFSDLQLPDDEEEGGQTLSQGGGRADGLCTPAVRSATRIGPPVLEPGTSALL